MSTGQAPQHPGPMLRTDILNRLGLSVSQAAQELKVARQTLHSVLAGRAALSPEMALRLAKLTSTRPETWLAMQQRHDLWQAEQGLADILATIAVLPAPRLLRPTARAARV